MIFKTANETQKKLLQLRLTNLKKVQNALKDEAIKELIKKWDNKIYNKRFLTALNNIANVHGVTFYFDEWQKTNNNKVDIFIKFYRHEDRSITGMPDSNGYQHTSYIDTIVYSLFYFKANESMNAEKIIEHLELKTKQNNKDVEQFENQLNNIDDMLYQYNELYAQFETFKDSINSNIKYFLDLTK